MYSTLEECEEYNLSALTILLSAVGDSAGRRAFTGPICGHDPGAAGLVLGTVAVLRAVLRHPAATAAAAAAAISSGTVPASKCGYCYIRKGVLTIFWIAMNWLQML